MSFRSVGQRASDAARRFTPSNRPTVPGAKRPNASGTLRNNLHVKEWFLDREEVIQLIGRRQAFVFTKFGLSTMRKDRRSQKFRVGPSLPGQPPHAHNPHPYVRKFTYFSYDPNKNSVVIGPYLLPGKRKTKSIQTVPETLEYGKGAKVKNTRRRETEIGGTGLIRVDSGTRKVRDKRGKLRRVAFAKITNEEMLRRSEELQEEIYGRETFKVSAHPHTNPAFKETLPTLPRLWSAAWAKQK